MHRHTLVARWHAAQVKKPRRERCKSAFFGVVVLFAVIAASQPDIFFIFFSIFFVERCAPCDAGKYSLNGPEEVYYVAHENFKCARRADMQAGILLRTSTSNSFSVTVNACKAGTNPWFSISVH